MNNTNQILTKKDNKLFDFMNFLNSFALVERNKIKNNGQRETDSEHTYQLCMVCWYLNSVYKLGLNIDLILKYCLVHDLPETLAGDVDSFTKHRNSSSRSQSEKENNAALEISKRFREFPDFKKYYIGYEKRDNEESRFVYSVDKLVAIINVYLFKNDHYFIKNNISKIEVLEERLPRISEYPMIKDVFLRVIDFFEHEKMFPK